MALRERWLFVCTGNTCRSPMMAALTQARLSAIGRTDIAVQSAGTGADLGEPASFQAISAMARRGLDLHGHRSQPVPADLAAFTRIWAMTSRHAAALRQRGATPAQLAVLAADSGGITDPFGGTLDDYLACAAQLDAEAALIIAALDPR